MISKLGLKSLRTKIIILTFMPTAIILAAIAIIGIYAYGQVVETQIITNGREDIRLTAERLGSQLTEYENLLAPLARRSELSSDDPQVRQAMLDQSLQELSVFDGGVLVLNHYGKVIAVGPQMKLVKDQDWSGYDFFQKMVISPNTLYSQASIFNETLTITRLSQLQPFENYQKKVALVAVPIYKEQGEFAGVLAGTFNLGKDSTSSFYGSLVKLHIAADKTVFLVDSLGSVLYHTSDDEIGKNYSDRLVVQMVNSGKIDALHIDDENGRPALISFAPIPHSTWALVIQQSWESLLEPGLNYWRTLSILLLVGLLLPAILVAFSVRKVTEPIWIINEAAKQVTAGNFKPEIRVNSGDELEELAHQFNHMSHSLAHNIDTLQKTNRSLQALRQCNQALVHAADEQLLLNQICQIFVNIGDYPLAWVGYAQKDEHKEVVRVAKAGADTSFLDDIQVTWGDDEWGSGSVGYAIRGQKPVIVDDILTDPKFKPWRGRAAHYQYRSVISLPLVYQENILGVIVIYSQFPNAFKQNDINMLDDLAKDLAYGIATLRIQVERIKTDAELARHRNHLEELVRARTIELDLVNQDLIKAKDAAEEADRIKSAFLATMSHELRTPLNSIIGFTGIILQGLAGPLNEEQGKQLGFVQTSAYHLLELINDVLDISKIEAGQLNILPEPFNLNQSIQKVVQLVTPLANKKNLPIRLQVDPQMGVMVNDHRRIEQVLINLLNNAIKFTDNGYVEFICCQSDKNVVLSVCDTGIGIKPEQLEKIFKPFSQIDTGLTRKYEGTGLGLSISKKMVEKMGGTLTLESQWDIEKPPFRSQGVGSTFIVTLPLEFGKAP